MYSDRDIEAVLNRADITDVVERRIGQLGKGNKACCPFHKEKTPSFHVNARTQTWHCFGGCPQGDNGGDAIAFVMKYDHLSFPEAVKQLAKDYGVKIEETKEPRTADEIARDKKREAMRMLNEWACQFYVAAIHDGNDKAKFALNYAINSRGWGAAYVEENNIGYADGASDSLYQAARKAGHSIDLMVELGLLNKNDKGEIYDFYRNRLMIPIKDRFRHIIGFTARDLTGTSKAKYFNSRASDLYDKKTAIFGIDNAIRQGIKDDVFYLVEGAPDAIKLQSLGITNTVAPLGGAWSATQLMELKRHASRVCFIPDADPPKAGEKMGAGKKFVCSNGLAAMKAGLGVIVKEIPLTDEGEKQDPDSFISSSAVLEGIESKDFIVWYATILFHGTETVEAKAEVVTELANMMANIHDNVKVQMLLKQLQKLYPDKTLWKSALAQARKADKEKKVSTKNGQLINRELLDKYGFYAVDNCYFAMGNNGEQQWSNFTMEPMYHIKDIAMSKRLYRIKNANGQEEIIELLQEDLCSLSKFRTRIESLGNFIWMAKEEHLTRLKRYLYEQTETAVEITQLGWQRKGFWSFGNGAQSDDEWRPTDEYGIVRLGDKGNWYLPSSSKIFREEAKLFVFERNFVHLGLGSITLHDFAVKFIDVFGENAKIGLCYLLATLFRDVVFGYCNHFPILNLFGPVGTGKSAIAETLMAFFIADNKPANLTNTTVPALSFIVAQCSNALIHIDEYKNDVDYLKVDFLKGLWDGVGRSRMATKIDNKREVTATDSGIILSGQEMPTADIALFTRVLFLTCNKNSFFEEMKPKFDEVKAIRKVGLTHLTLQILKHRAKFEAEFVSNYRTALSDLIENVRGLEILDRIRDNWAIPLAAFRTLSGVLDLPMEYKDLLKICAEHVIEQNKECKTSNELANFWNVVAFLFQDGQIYRDSDFRVKYVKRWKTDTTGIIEWSQARPVLLLQKNRIFNLYKRNGRLVGDTVLPSETLAHYLEHSKEYIGLKKSVRFKNIIDGRHETMTVIDEHGNEKLKNTDHIDRAYCFDYNMLKENYGINLDVVATAVDDDDLEELTPKAPEPKQKELWAD